MKEVCIDRHLHDVRRMNFKLKYGYIDETICHLLKFCTPDEAHAIDFFIRAYKLEKGLNIADGEDVTETAKQIVSWLEKLQMVRTDHYLIEKVHELVLTDEEKKFLNSLYGLHEEIKAKDTDFKIGDF